MNTEKKILACVDQSHFADYVADYAAWAARRLEAPLEFIHVIDRHAEIAPGKDRSGAIGVGAQELLLAELSEQDEARSKAERERGRIFLNRLRERAKAAGVDPGRLSQIQYLHSIGMTITGISAHLRVTYAEVNAAISSPRK